MKIKELREKLNYSQAQLAEMLDTTQQTISKWEAGTTEPSIAALRDLAMIFGCSVDDLLGLRKVSKANKLRVTIPYADAYSENLDGYWGNLGLLMKGRQFTKWYPISAQEKNHVERALQNDPGAELGWLIVQTLNNRILAVNLKAMRRIWLLDEACDQPDGDWKDFGDTIVGLPLELYRGLSQWSDGEPRTYEAKTSVKFRDVIAKYIEAEGLDEDGARERVHNTHIYELDGSASEFWALEEDVYEVIEDCQLYEENGLSLVRLRQYGGDFDCYFPTDNIACFDFPLIDYLDEHARIRAEYEAEDA